jgi:hypothetical protein
MVPSGPVRADSLQRCAPVRTFRGCGGWVKRQLFYYPTATRADSGKKWYNAHMAIGTRPLFHGNGQIG